MNDYLVRALAREAGVRVIVSSNSGLALEAADRHGTFPIASIALGHALTGAALMGAMLKVRQRIAIKFEGSGPLQKILVESDNNGRIRGYVSQPLVNLPSQTREQVAAALGDTGLLTVVRDVLLPELVESTVPLSSGDIAVELTFFLNQSEQIPSLIEISHIADEDGTLQAVGGLLIQALPPYETDIVQQLRNNIQELPPVADLLHSDKTPEEILALLFGKMPYKLLEQRPLRFECGCSRSRSEQALISLGAIELRQIINTEGEAIVDCHFCHEQYLFSREELEALLETM
ncbi:Hsp33 family molecular chaperone HslO [Candidatus Leptofilum sp.]|uniref:Hsp33 family molecular chaperone HslO n=1 Tax=Candidatus Leptofilum sp. TaxID=3241576 RepID=UPI003B5C6A18